MTGLKLIECNGRELEIERPGNLRPYPFNLQMTRKSMGKGVSSLHTLRKSN